MGYPSIPLPTLPPPRFPLSKIPLPSLVQSADAALRTPRRVAHKRKLGGATVAAVAKGVVSAEAATEAVRWVRCRDIHRWISEHHVDTVGIEGKKVVAEVVVDD